MCIIGGNESYESKILSRLKGQRVRKNEEIAFYEDWGIFEFSTIYDYSVLNYLQEVDSVVILLDMSQNLDLLARKLEKTWQVIAPHISQNFRHPSIPRNVTVSLVAINLENDHDKEKKHALDKRLSFKPTPGQSDSYVQTVDSAAKEALSYLNFETFYKRNLCNLINDESLKEKLMGFRLYSVYHDTSQWTVQSIFAEILNLAELHYNVSDFLVALKKYIPKALSNTIFYGKLPSASDYSTWTKIINAAQNNSGIRAVLNLMEIDYTSCEIRTPTLLVKPIALEKKNSLTCS